MIYVFLADGFEEIEALTPVDLLRRADLQVATVGVTGRCVTGAHGIAITADITPVDVSYETMEGIVLPGGMPGTLNLEASSFVQESLNYAVSNRLLIAAICAAPSILGHKGLLNGKRATCYPGFEETLQGAVISRDTVVTDGLFTTAKGAGVATEFALELIKRFKDQETADTIRGAIQCR